MAATRKKARPARSPARAKRTPRARTALKSSVGTIAHTELASADPAATREWARKALGWTFMPPMPSPAGEYHMVDSGKESGRGIRSNHPPEAPGTLVYVEVADIARGYEKALKHGAKPMMAPTLIGGGMGTMAVVVAPGNVPIGLWAAK